MSEPARVLIVPRDRATAGPAVTRVQAPRAEGDPSAERLLVRVRADAPRDRAVRARVRAIRDPAPIHAIEVGLVAMQRRAREPANAWMRRGTRDLPGHVAQGRGRSRVARVRLRDRAPS